MKLDRVADRNVASLDEAGDDPAGIEAINILHGEPQRCAFDRRRGAELLERFEQGGAAMPRRVRARVDQALAVLGRDRDEVRGRDVELAQEFGELGADAVEGFLVVVDEVHLVHRDDDLLEAEEGEQIAVAARLLAEAFMRVDDQDGGVGAGGAADHVLEKFLVAGASMIVN